MIELIFQIIAVGLAGSTAYFWWTADADKAFASFVLAASAFFLGYRFRLKKRLAERKADETPLHD